MRRLFLTAILLVALAAPATAHASTPVMGNADAQRTGWYPDQGSLTPALLKSGSFGQVFSTAVNGQVYAQPLLSNGVLFVATDSNWIYGLDPASGAVKWSRNLGTPFRSSDVACGDLSPSIGVTGTPAIDPDTGTAYFFSKSYDAGGEPGWWAHAVDLTTGADRSGFPVQITGTAQNRPSQSFTPKWEMQRPGLLLMNGVVYAAFGAHCDAGSYQGWVIGVSTAGQVKARWVDGTGTGGGIWQGGGGIMSDGAGRLVVASGNGNLNTTATPGSSPPANLGESVARLSVQSDGTLRSSDFFEPYDASDLDTSDADFGSGGPVSLPSGYFGTASIPHLMVALGKEGWMYLLNRDSLGGYKQGASGADLVVARIEMAGGEWSKPAVWPGDGGWVYAPTNNCNCLGFYKYATDGSGRPTLSSQTHTTDSAMGYTSGAPTVTSNGTASGSAIVWVIAAPNVGGTGATLRAYSAVPASGAAQLLFSAPIGTASKFQQAGIGGNRVYVGTRDGHVIGFGAPVNAALTGSSTDFGTVTTGQQVTKNVTLTAARQTKVTGVSISGSQFSAGTVSPSLPATLAAGAKLTVPVTFSPTASGPAGGTLTVSTESDGPVPVSLSGSGQAAAAELAITPPALSLGGAVVGQQASGTVTFTNSGGQALTVNAAVSPGAPFSTSGMPAAGSKIQPGQSITATVTFSPATTGDYSDQVGLDTSAGTQTVPVTATATTAPRLVIAPPVVDYGPVAVGSATDASFTLSNPGGGTLTINKSKPPLSDSFTASTSLGEGTTIPSGGSLIEHVVFKPAALGAAASAWQLTGDDGSGLHVVSLTGNGVTPVSGTTPPASIVPAVLPVPSASLSRLRLSKARFASGVARKRHRSERTGADIGFSVSRATVVRFTVKRLVAGHRKGRSCVGGRPQRGGRPCMRWVTLGPSFEIAGSAGSNSFRFVGRVGGRALAVGRYLLVAAPAGRAATAATVPFAITG